MTNRSAFTLLRVATGYYDEVENAASDLWSWIDTGSSDDEERPDAAEVMRRACHYIEHLTHIQRLQRGSP